ncbi:hypothetical protein [Burkholderia ubonensis]|nr:hypothetical protein [Burkholderia ubonensis]
MTDQLFIFCLMMIYVISVLEAAEPVRIFVGEAIEQLVSCGLA